MKQIWKCVCRHRRLILIDELLHILSHHRGIFNSDMPRVYQRRILFESGGETQMSKPAVLSIICFIIFKRIRQAYTTLCLLWSHTNPMKIQTNNLLVGLSILPKTSLPSLWCLTSSPFSFFWAQKSWKNKTIPQALCFQRLINSLKTCASKVEQTQRGVYSAFVRDYFQQWIWCISEYKQQDG